MFLVFFSLILDILTLAGTTASVYFFMTGDAVTTGVVTATVVLGAQVLRARYLSSALADWRYLQYAKTQMLETSLQQEERHLERRRETTTRYKEWRVARGYDPNR